jgi:hypothetical protein
MGYVICMPNIVPSKRIRIAKDLDKKVTRILCWDSHHSLVSTPIWIPQLLDALPDAVMISRIEDTWTATHADVTTTGWTLSVALGLLIVELHDAETA